MYEDMQKAKYIHSIISITYTQLLTLYHLLNSLRAGISGCNFTKCNFQSCFTDWHLQINCNDDALRWMPQDLTDDESIFMVQIMAWCHQATSHYLSQFWPRFMSPYDISKPQWVKKKYAKVVCYYIITNITEKFQNGIHERWIDENI